MTSYMLIRHKCKDFTIWKAEHDAHLAKHFEAGLTEKFVLQGADDPNEVVILFETQDINRAKAFAASAELRERMQAVGVIDKPDIFFLKD